KAPVEFKLGYQVSADFFQALKVQPLLGRSFQPDDEISGREPVVVLSHELWKNEFGGQQSAIGRRVLLNKVLFTVVGVAPESFTGMDQFLRPELFVPASMGAQLYSDLIHQQTDRTRRVFLVKGRLKPGISIRAAADEAASISRSLEQLNPATNRGFRATVSSEIEMRLVTWPILGGFSGALMTVASVTLFIACANVASLMLGRGRTRAREIAVRLAIG